MSKVIVEINNIVFDNWKSVSITKDMNSICGTFSMTAFYDYTGSKTPWQLSGVIKISYIDDKNGKYRVMTGYVESVNTSITNGGLNVQIAGRDITCDLVDCTFNDKTEIMDITVLEMYKSFVEPYDLNVWSLLPSSKDNKIVKRKNNTANEKVGDVIVSISKELGIIPTTDGTGDLILEGKSDGIPIYISAEEKLLSGRIDGQLVLGTDGNILEASHNSDYTKRYSSIRVIDNADNETRIIEKDGASTAIDGLAVDPTYDLKTINKKVRTRMLTTTSTNSGKTDIEKLEEEANWKMMLSRASVSTIKVKVQGWLASDELWTINRVVDCDLSVLGLEKSTMLIKAITFEISDGGSFTNMELVHSNSFEDITFKTSDDEKTTQKRFIKK